MTNKDNFNEEGDRAPNFILTDQNEEQFELYTTMSGGPIVLVILPHRNLEDQELIKLFKKSYSKYKKLGIDLFVVSDASKDTISKISNSLNIQFPLMADHDGSVTTWFLSSSNTQGPVAFILDPNQRLFAIERDDEKEKRLPEKALDLAKRKLPIGSPKNISEIAPVLIIPKIFSEDICHQMIELWTSSGNSPGQVETSSQKISDHTIKRRKDHLINDKSLEIEISNILGKRIAPEVSKVYHCENWIFEGFRIGCYDYSDSGFFSAHRDNFNQNNKSRLYAITINLNVGEYTGGELRFSEYGQDLYSPPTGGAIIFSCSLLHEVLPVMSGRRLVFLTFLRKPPSTKQD